MLDLIPVVAAFLIYEYLITFDKEVEYFWMRRPNCGSVFFLFTRYVPLVIKAIDMSGYIHMSDKVSNPSSGAHCLYDVYPHNLLQRYESWTSCSKWIDH